MKNAYRITMTIVWLVAIVISIRLMVMQHKITVALTAKYKPMTPSCALVKITPNQTHCTPITNGMECNLGDVPPESWGRCIEGMKSDFTCLKNDTLAYYKDEDEMPRWKIPAANCPALRKQIIDNYHDPVLRVPVPTPGENPTQPPESEL